MGRDEAGDLAILHVLRAPLGGLFRHVLDLTREQIARGHRVGLIADSMTGGPQADAVLRELEPQLALGLSRTPMRRSLHPSDARAFAHVTERIRTTRPDIVHGHGSKGGAFARLAAASLGRKSAKIAYTPHGGSFNYRPGQFAHVVYMAAERLLAPRTDVFLFESAYIRSRFHECATRRLYRERVVLNGIADCELTPVAPRPDAADFLYVGELRSAKGVDTLIDALAETARLRGRAPTAVLVGSGPDEAQLQQHVARKGLQAGIRFPGRMPARAAFALGRNLVVPSRAESLPYVVLEAAGAQVPMIATSVGGIPEIFGPYSDQLIVCDNVPILAGAMTQALSATDEERAGRAELLAKFVATRFTIAAMVDSVIAGYREALSGTVESYEIATAPAPLSSR